MAPDTDPQYRRHLADALHARMGERECRVARDVDGARSWAREAEMHLDLASRRRGDLRAIRCVVAA